MAVGKASIALKIAVLAISLVMVTALVQWRTFRNYSSDLLLDHEEVDLREEARVTTNDILTVIATLREDILTLSGSPALHGVVRSRTNEVEPGVDPVTKLSDDELLDGLEQEFRAVYLPVSDRPVAGEGSPASDKPTAEPKPYLQIRLIADEKFGCREILRVERKKLGEEVVEVRRVPDDKLQEKCHEKYFTQTKALEPQQVYLSPVELNSETNEDGDKVKIREQPVLRAAVPVYSPDYSPGDSQEAKRSKFFGIVIINLDFQEIADNLKKSPRHLYYLVNDQGDFLVHPMDANREFLWDLPSEKKTLPIQEDVAYKDLPGLSNLFPPAEFDDYDHLLETFGKRITNRQDEDEANDAVPLERDKYSLMYIAIKDVTAFDTSPDKKSLPDRLKEFQAKDERLRLMKRFGASISRRFPVSHPDRGKLLEIKAQLEKSDIADKIQIEDPVDCQNFMVQLYRMYFDPRQPNRHLTLLGAFSEEEIKEEFAPTLGDFFVEGILIVTLTVVLALVLARLITLPLAKITDATKTFAAGDYDEDLPVHRRDEIGVLARAFQSMTQTVRDRDKELRVREERLRQILMNAAEGIIAVDELGVITRMNDAANEIFGFEVDDSRGVKLVNLLVDGEDLVPDPLAQSMGFDALLRAERKEGIGRRKDGTEFPLEIAISDFRFEGHFTRTAIVRDITERKRHEERLQLWNDELTTAVKHRTAELEEKNAELTVARDKAEQLNTAKSAFLATVSHELRNPLNQVSGFCQLLEMTDLDEEQLADLNKIRTASSQLLTLVNDILDYQKIIMGGLSLECEDVEVAGLMGELRDAMHVQANHNGNQLAFECAEDIGTVYADKQRTRQVLLNLLGNACKFTKEGVVTLRAQRNGEGDNHWIEFSVIDNGEGIRPELQANLFQPFVKASAREGNQKGTGLGLVISKGICEGMRGDISFASEYRKGTTFTVRLPCSENDRLPGAPETQHVVHTHSRDDVREAVVRAAKAAVRAVEDGVDEGQSPNDRTVLVIDDESEAREMMERYLVQRGFQVVTASNGLQGLELAARLHPAVITLDAKMPGLDGWAALAALKANRDTTDIPVVMVTIMDDAERGQDLGAADFLKKPVDWDRLSTSLSKYTGSKRDRSVLVVDDDPQTREILRRNLEKDGWGVLEAAHGAEALQYLAHEQPAAIILDLMMPVMDGFEFLAEYSQLAEWLAVPVLVLTSKDPTPEEIEKLEGHVVRVLRKGSYSNDELLQEIHRRVDKHVHPQAAKD